jgi:hypothetical protein
MRICTTLPVVSKFKNCSAPTGASNSIPIYTTPSVTANNSPSCAPACMLPAYSCRLLTAPWDASGSSCPRCGDHQPLTSSRTGTASPLQAQPLPLLKPQLRVGWPKKQRTQNPGRLCWLWAVGACSTFWSAQQLRIFHRRSSSMRSRLWCVWQHSSSTAHATCLSTPPAAVTA